MNRQFALQLYGTIPRIELREVVLGNANGVWWQWYDSDTDEPYYKPSRKYATAMRRMDQAMTCAIGAGDSSVRRIALAMVLAAAGIRDKPLGIIWGNGQIASGNDIQIVDWLVGGPDAHRDLDGRTVVLLPPRRHLGYPVVTLKLMNQFGYRWPTEWGNNVQWEFGKPMLITECIGAIDYLSACYDGNHYHMSCHTNFEWVIE